MKVVLLMLTALAATALAAFVYQQAYVEGGFGPAAMIGTFVLALVTLLMAVLAYLSGTRHRGLVANALMVCSATAVTYVVVDVAAGRLLIVPLSPPLVPDPYRHHALVPDSYAELRQPDFQYI